MIADFFVLLWVLALGVPLYWAVPAAWRRVRFTVICLVSAFLLWLLSPLIFLTVAGYAAVLAGFVAAQARGVPRRLLKALSWTVFLPLAAFEQIPPEFVVEGLLGQAALGVPVLVGLTFLGVSYTAIRCFLMIRETIEQRGPDFFEAATTFLFFGSFVAGPITGSSPFQKASARLTWADTLMAVSRLGWGAALFLVIKPYVEGLDPAALLGLAEDGRAAAWLAVYHRFLTLYIDFTGYTDVAIGCALFFGIRLPENFNWPLRARSIQEFWQRWHLSLGAFIGTYLFKPFVRQTGRPSLAIFLAFTTVGLWHAVTWPYFIWGLGHGAALALHMLLRKAIPLKNAPRAVTLGVGIGGWALTLSYVALLSALANSSDVSSALDLLAVLF